jgi:hypothetical protein
MLSHLPLVTIDDSRKKRVINGRAFDWCDEQHQITEAGSKTVRVCDKEDTLVAVGEYDAVRRIVSPRVVMANEVA